MFTINLHRERRSGRLLGRYAAGHHRPTRDQESIERAMNSNREHCSRAGERTFRSSFDDVQQFPNAE